jgi:site-specific DNA recombinase
LVEKEVFEQVQSFLRKRSFGSIHPKRVSSNYLLSGLVKCGYCGRNLIGQDAKGGRFHYYVCNTLRKKGAGSCRATYINKEKLEEAVLSKIRTHILTYENLKELVDIVNDTRECSVDDDRERLNSIISDLNNINQRLERLYDALETGTLILADLAPRIQSLRQQQEQLVSVRIELESRLSDTKVELTDMETVKCCLDVMRNVLNRSEITERKSFVRSFVKAVKVKGSEVSLEYTPDLLAGIESKETFRVLPIIQNGGQYWTRTSDLSDVNRVL